ncbi:MAG: hypothetical protein ACFFAL_00610 [Promethearchaeota archaeon]
MHQRTQHFKTTSPLTLHVIAQRRKKAEIAVARFKYYTIYRCRHCGEHIRVHGKLASKLVLPSGVQMCCTRPRLVRERQVLISDYESDKPTKEKEEPRAEKVTQKSLSEYSKK